MFQRTVSPGRDGGNTARPAAGRHRGSAAYRQYRERSGRCRAASSGRERGPRVSAARRAAASARAMSRASRCSLNAGRGPVQPGSPPSQRTSPSLRPDLCRCGRWAGSPLGVRMARMRTIATHFCAKSCSCRPIVSACCAASRQKAGAALGTSIRRKAASAPGSRPWIFFAAAQAAAQAAALGVSRGGIDILLPIQLRMVFPHHAVERPPRPRLGPRTKERRAGYGRQRAFQSVFRGLLQIFKEVNLGVAVLRIGFYPTPQTGEKTAGPRRG